MIAAFEKPMLHTLVIAIVPATVGAFVAWFLMRAKAAGSSCWGRQLSE